MKDRQDQHQKQVKAFLTSDELYSIEKILNRKPNEFELNMFAAMWSEHISYKSSVKWIEDLPVNGQNVRIPARAENAGIIDLDDELSCVIKMESHNHPLAGDPGEAAVGVGNVFRDLIAMGARPIAHLNILRFGNLKDDAVRRSVKNIIRALGSYSNNFGVPVVGGEVLFDSSYTKNPLLNLLAIGIVRKDRVITASFKEKGNSLYIIGGKTTGSGVHGAGFASTPFSQNTVDLIPETQLADPYAGKILYECIMELNENGLIRGMQDVGAGGVLCAAAEMAFRGSKGVSLNINDFPVNHQNMDPIDILLSQSQEQMLISLNDADRKLLKEIAAKYNISFASIGKVTDDNRIRIRNNSKTLADLPVPSLVRGGGAPVYIRNREEPLRKVVHVTSEEVPVPGNLKEVARILMTNPNVASRRWIYEQFDTMAGLSNVGSDYAADAGVVNIPGKKKLIALSVDGNSRYVRKEPRKGTMIAVAEAARNIVCTGGKPVALADGLNFGDPADPHVYYDFTECVKGIKQMSELMDIPIIAGNVSFNNLTRNEQETISVHPTPVIGMVGIIEDMKRIMSISFRSKGDMIYIIGKSDNDLSGSEYLSVIHLAEDTAAPKLELESELKLHEVVGMLIEKKHISSAHDVSLGGLFVALVECCIENSLGFDITSPAEVRTDAFLFGESQSRIIVSVRPEQETAFLDFMIESKFPFSALGHVTKQELRIDDGSFGFITDYVWDYENALEEQLNIIEEE